MIFYFTGTGNSRWVAEKLAKALGENVIDIGKLNRQIDDENEYEYGLDYKYIAKEGEIIGIVFPIHAWMAPGIVMDFLKRINLRKDTYSFAVATCGEEVGYGVDEIVKSCKLKSGYSVVMPNNYLLGINIDSVEVQRNKLDKATIKVQRIATSINNREETLEVYRGRYPFLKSRIANALFVKFGMDSRKYWVEESCIGCGQCEAKCPTGCISLVNKKPVWSSGCIQCMACINCCPVGAIQYGNTTKNKGRYCLKEE